jgi:hypothetical protein
LSDLAAATKLNLDRAQLEKLNRASRPEVAAPQ